MYKTIISSISLYITSILSLSKNSSNKGVSLLEIGMAFAIGSSIIAGVVGGAKLIDNSRLGVIVNDVNRFTVAAAKFEKKYGAIPGDMENFSTVLDNDNESDNINGDGNLKISKGTKEELLFWIHLQESGFYKSNVESIISEEGSSNNLYYLPPGTDLKSTIPAGPFDNSRYRVSYENGRLYFYVSGYDLKKSQDGSDDFGVIPPEMAWKIDKEYDDGFPNSGRIQGLNSEQDQRNICSKKGENKYHLKNTKNACIIRISATALSVRNENQDLPNCDGIDIGTKRISPTLCPAGSEGKVYEICTAEGWITSYERCELTKCSNNLPIGSKRKKSCPQGYYGAIIEECSSDGSWSITNNCDTPTAGSACTSSLTIPCMPGESGNIKYTCSGGILSSPTDTCQAIGCGAESVGETRESSCPENYTGKIIETCTYDTRDGKGWKATSNSCVPDSGPCRYSVDENGKATNKRSLACPTGELGSITQICHSSSKWVVSSSSCNLISCGGEYYVGDYKDAKASLQCESTIGNAIEICSISDTGEAEWVLDASNCVPPDELPTGVLAPCPSESAEEYLLWPETEPGQIGEVVCKEGYKTSDGETAKRICSDRGKWLDPPTNECLAYSFDQPDYYSNLYLWLDASDSSTFDQTPPEYWYNKADNSRIKNLESYGNGADKRPAYNTTAPNGLRVLTFNDYQNMGTQQNLYQKLTYSMFVIAKIEDFSGNSLIRVNNHEWIPTESGLKIINKEARTKTDIISDKEYMYNFDLTKWNIIYIEVDNSFDISLYANNSFIGKSDVMLDYYNYEHDRFDDRKLFTIGAHNESTKDAYIGEVIIYDRILTEEKKMNIYNYLKNKWGL